MSYLGEQILKRYELEKLIKEVMTAKQKGCQPLSKPESSNSDDCDEYGSYDTRKLGIPRIFDADYRYAMKVKQRSDAWHNAWLDDDT